MDTFNKINNWISIVLVCMACFFFGSCNGVRTAHKEAVSIGLGIFINNPSNIFSTFMWKDGTNLIPERPILTIKIGHDN